MIFNTTITALTIASFNSPSSLCALSNSRHSFYMKIDRSNFNYFVTHALYGKTSSQFSSITFQKTVFNHFLSNSVAFENQLQMVKDRQITEHYHYDSKSSITELYVLGCIFSSISSNEYGAAIYIQKDMNVKLNQNQFNDCHTKSERGGALYIVKQDGHLDQADFKNYQGVKNLDIQFCCFSNCYGSEAIYGSCLFSCSENTTLFYTSTIECSNVLKATGAQFDMQSPSNVQTQFVNISLGCATYCGGIEYRNARQGFFQYQTITGLCSCFATSFTAVDINNIEIANSNYFNNSIQAPGNKVPPALVHARDKNIRLINFYFVSNSFSKVYDMQPLLASIQSTGGLSIELINCYADIDDAKLWSIDYISTSQCHFENSSITTPPMSQLLLGRCEGNRSPVPLNLTEAFSPSNFFSSSDKFTPSDVPTIDPSPTAESDTTTKDKNPISFPAIAGICVAAAVLIAGIVAGLVIFKRRHLPELANEEMTAIDNADNLVTNDNPLYDQKGGDDPFREDFENN